jgi:hypothetical protein
MFQSITTISFYNLKHRQFARPRAVSLKRMTANVEFHPS